jgi:rubrerythrin
MSIRFNVGEILEMAETIETNGERFYRKAAGMVADESAKKILTGLADAEVIHKKIFADMRTDLTAQEKGESFVAPDEEASQYLRAWADGQVFDARKDPSEELTGKESLEDLLRMALGREKDSVVFYLGLKEGTPKKWGREKIDSIIKEEMLHISIISTELAKLRGELN